MLVSAGCEEGLRFFGCSGVFEDLRSGKMFSKEALTLGVSANGRSSHPKSQNTKQKHLSQ